MIIKIKQWCKVMLDPYSRTVYISVLVLSVGLIVLLPILRLFYFSPTCLGICCTDWAAPFSEIVGYMILLSIISGFLSTLGLIFYRRNTFLRWINYGLLLLTMLFLIALAQTIGLTFGWIETKSCIFDIPQLSK